MITPLDAFLKFAGSFGLDLDETTNELTSLGSNYCAYCGTTYHSNRTNCMNCGAPLYEKQST